VVDVHVVFGALIGAISWNLITWFFGIPSSSSHALIGGIVGSVIAKAGTSASAVFRPHAHGVVHFRFSTIGLFVGFTDDAAGELVVFKNTAFIGG
jgi:phosphate/sulfate permease